ncbi:hypothetical protein S7335_1824 [Synechococcus sp. PCC 7335]|uniref:WD40 repeat domain-containing protein n=1 Tax=Synechococcus sp. (strain ATCC 29403 / PCC 7335) TaxID=91464 RepID=UPI00017EDCE2|nr:WD40 repeat domain-containing protein [Synechococcus sp. PCC 7335]EDX84127.1 hypothetical protein S7335_1824 [Synechococcus sp. PCC 7335]
MFPKNRNTFPLIAVLLSAGVVAGLSGIFLLISERLESGINITSEVSVRGQSTIQTSSAKILGSHAATVLSLATTGPLVASSSYNNTVKLWNQAEPEIARSLDHKGKINDLVFTADGQQLITASSSGDISLWNIPSTELSTSFAGSSARIMSVAVSSDNTRFAVGDSSGAIQTWTLDDTLKSIRSNPWGSDSEFPEATTLNTAGPQINTLAFHPANSNLLISGDQAGTIRVWDIAQQKNTLTLEVTPERVLSLSINDKGYIASGHSDASIRIWNLENTQLTQTLVNHDLVVADVAFSPDGTLLASASYDETIKVWDWQRSEVLCTLKGHSGFVYSVAFSGAGDTLMSGGYDGTIRAWDLTAVVNKEC